MLNTHQRYTRGQVWHHINRDTSEDNVLQKNRPVVIVSCNHNNQFDCFVQVVPVGSGEFANNVGLIGVVPFNGIPYLKAGYLITNQIKTVSTADLSDYIVTLDDDTMHRVSESIIQTLVLTPAQEKYQERYSIGLPKSRPVQDEDDLLPEIEVPKVVEVYEQIALLPTELKDPVKKEVGSKVEHIKPQTQHKRTTKIILSDTEKVQLRSDMVELKVSDILKKWGFSSFTYYRFKNEFSKEDLKKSEEQRKEEDSQRTEDEQFLYDMKFLDRREVLKKWGLTGKQAQERNNELINRKYVLRAEVASMII